MTQEFIPYEQALELKQLGFNEHCFGEWQNLKIGKNLVVDEEDRIYDISVLGADIKAPLYQQAFRWFRNKYDKHCYVEAYTLSSGGKRYDYTILSNEGEEEWDDGETWETYEQAELACLKELIKIIKNK
jgi:hypothetical protein